MKVLIVKTSSMGDIIHTLPAITDATNAIENIEFFWVVEESFQEIPRWMPSVKKIIPIALRRWKKQGWVRSAKEIQQFITNLRSEHYDLIIDAQGLLKSALVTRFARGLRVGLAYSSAREPAASFFYSKKMDIPKAQHAITRTRELFSKALNYPLPIDAPYAQISLPTDVDLPINQAAKPIPKNTVLFFHGTTWLTKHWPEAYWLELATIAKKAGLTPLLPWNSTTEHERAARIATATDAILLPKLSLTQMAGLLLNVSACVAVDTGLGHLAATLGTPTISLYGPTDTELTGTLGRNQYHLVGKLDCAPCFKEQCKIKKIIKKEDFPPCFAEISPSSVLKQLLEVMEAGK